MIIKEKIILKTGYKKHFSASQAVKKSTLNEENLRNFKRTKKNTIKSAPKKLETERGIR